MIHTDVVGIELVHSNEGCSSQSAETPGRDSANDRELSCVEVVNYNLVELNPMKIIRHEDELRVGTRKHARQDDCG